MDPLKRTLTNKRIERLLKVINLLRELDREVPAQTLATFFYVASHDKCHKAALEEDLNFSAASSSRNTQWLTHTHRLRKPGLNLIKKEVDPCNNRRLILSLSEEGKELIEEIEQLLYD